MAMTCVALRVAPSYRSRVGTVIDALMLKGFILQGYRNNIGVLMGSCPEDTIATLREVEGVEETQVNREHFQAVRS